MSCNRIQDKLMLFQARELPERDSDQIRRHLRSCACCSAVASELRELERIAGYAVSTSVAAPPGLDARIMTAIRKPTPAGFQRMARLPLPWRLRRLAIAALTLFFLTGAFAVGHWIAYREVNDRMEQWPAPVRCEHENMIPSVHALPKVNGRIVAPGSPEYLAIVRGSREMAANGHMRKHGKACRCWEGKAPMPSATAPP